MYLNPYYPLYADDNLVTSIEPDNEFLNAVKEHCPNRANEYFEDVYPIWVCYKILSVIGEVKRLSYFDTGERFGEQVRGAFEMLEPKTVNYIRKFIGERKFGNLYFENIVFNEPLEEYMGMPNEIEFGSEPYAIWKNFMHCAADNRVTISDCINMTANEHLTRYREILLRSSGEVRLKEIHDEVTEEYNKIVALIEAERLEKPFPMWDDLPKVVSPPEGIVQLTNGKELLAEGQKMHHCVASYVSTCLSGSSYIFHVQRGKDEATLELTKDGRINQFKSFHNNSPSSRLRDLVDTWLSQKA
jgi:hypothetical protein